MSVGFDWLAAIGRMRRPERALAPRLPLRRRSIERVEQLLPADGCTRRSSRSASFTGHPLVPPADAIHPEAHPIALLLPWYVTGTLGSGERLQTDKHLATCASCRAELTSIRTLRGQLRRSGIERGPAAGYPAPAAWLPGSPSIGRRVGAWTRRMACGRFARRWLASVLLAVVLIESAAVLWLARPTSSATHVRLELAPTVLERHLRGQADGVLLAQRASP